MNDWTGLLLILIVVGVLAGSFGPLILGLIANSLRKRQLRLRGQRATVEILDIRDTRVTVNLNPRVEISVRMPDGSIGKFRTFVSRVKFPRPGEKIEVLYDPADPTVVLPF
jgi:hypothetical protein